MKRFQDREIINLNDKVSDIVKRTNKKNSFKLSNFCRRLGKFTISLDEIRCFDKDVFSGNLKVIHWKYKPLLESYEFYCISDCFPENYSNEIPLYEVAI